MSLSSERLSGRVSSGRECYGVEGSFVGSGEMATGKGDADCDGSMC